jgi:hypothetical protein
MQTTEMLLRMLLVEAWDKIVLTVGNTKEVP